LAGAAGWAGALPSRVLAAPGNDWIALGIHCAKPADNGTANQPSNKQTRRPERMFPLDTFELQGILGDRFEPGKITKVRPC